MLDKTALTAPERLQVWRRRLGLNQLEAGAHFGVGEREYGDTELGRTTAPRLRVPKAAPKWFGQMSQNELCFILRRRSGLSQRELAHKLRLTRMWVNRMEAGVAPIDRLASYWKL